MDHQVLLCYIVHTEYTLSEFGIRTWWITLWCEESDSFEMYFFLHTEQEMDFRRFLWMVSWVFSACFVRNPHPHWSHWTGLSFLQWSVCAFSELKPVNSTFFGQRGQVLLSRFSCRISAIFPYLFDLSPRTQLNWVSTAKETAGCKVATTTTAGMRGVATGVAMQGNKWNIVIYILFTDDWMCYN